ncbi:MAG TPA: serine protease [Thermoanaerobaculia bacterium]|nr:serine protease [Thermoanaerobaculia bacterium]
MSAKILPSTLVLAVVLAVLSAVPAAFAADAKAPIAADLEWLRQQTVLIQVTPDRPNANLETGSGVVLCEVDHRVFVVTANHVLFGTTATGKNRGSLLDVAKIRLSFSHDVARAVEEEPNSTTRNDVIQVTQLGSQDLLLLAFDINEDLWAFPSLTGGSAEPGRRVWAVGNPADQQETWAVEDGTLTRLDDQGHLLHTVPIVKGYSGGPLFDAAGELVGINVQQAEAPDEGGIAIPTESLKAAIGKKVPRACLKDEKAEADRLAAAEEAYREALRQVSRHDWAQAKASLVKARDNNPLEGGSVHLQGMRYTQYLPHFYLGLVAYRLAAERKDSKLCGEALTEFHVSEVQRVIEGSARRQRQLRRMRKRCQDPKGLL